MGTCEALYIACGNALHVADVAVNLVEVNTIDCESGYLGYQTSGCLQVACEIADNYRLSRIQFDVRNRGCGEPSDLAQQELRNLQGRLIFRLCRGNKRYHIAARVQLAARSITESALNPYFLIQATRVATKN